MGNTIISALLFQPPSPPNELDYFGNINSTTGCTTHDNNYNSTTKSQDGIIRGAIAAGGAQQQQQQQRQVVIKKHEPTLHYIWLVSPSSDTPIPVLHIRYNGSNGNSGCNSNSGYSGYSNSGSGYSGYSNSSSNGSNNNSSSSTKPPYTLLYSHGNAEDIGLLSEFLTDISRLLQVDILVYDYTGYGVGQDVRMICRFYGTWGIELEKWREWRRELLDDGSGGGTSGVSGGGGTSGKKKKKEMVNMKSGIRYSEDVFMAPMVFPKSVVSSSTTMNLENVYVCGDELDFIDDNTDATTTTNGGGGGRNGSSLLDVDDDDEEDDYEDDTDMPSVTTCTTCYDNSTMYGEEDGGDEEEDEVSLFTCGASRNEVEQEEDDTSSLSGSYHPRGNSAAGTAASRRRSSHRRRSKVPLTPKQKRRALLRKYNWTMPSPSEEQCYLDILLAYNYLRQVENIPAKHVVLYGKSVGSGPTCWLAQRSCQRSVDTGAGGTRVAAATATATGGRMVSTAGGNAYDDVRDDTNISMRDRHCDDDERGADEYGSGRATLGGKSGDDVPGGVALHSPFLSVIRVVLDMGFTTIGDLFPNIDRVKDFTCPVYIIHGTEDGIVPFYHGKGLFNALPDTSKATPFWAKGVGHNDIEVGMPTAYIKRLQQFIRNCDQVNYPPGEIQSPKAFSFSTGTSGTKSRSQEESGRALPGRKHTRQMSVSKQRKKKDTLVTNRGGHRYSTSASANNNMVATTPTKTKTRYHHPKSQDRSLSYHNPQQQQHHLRQQQYHYPSVMQNFSSDAAICGIQPQG